jgi:hypothetical protein
LKKIINTTCKNWEAENVMRSSNGKIFTVEHIKKDGTPRITNCRLAVSKGVIGTGLKYNPIERELLPVYDMQIKAHRMVNLKTVTKLNIYGVHYNVEGRQA